MKHMCKIGRLSPLALLALSVILVAFVACGSDTTPGDDAPASGEAQAGSNAAVTEPTPVVSAPTGEAPAATPVPTPTSVPPAATPVSTPTAVPPTATPVPTPASASSSGLDEYAAFCGELSAAGIDFAKYNSKQEFIADLDANIEKIEAVQPPPELADYHNLILAMQKAAKQALQDAPAPEPGGPLTTYLIGILSSVGGEYQPRIAAVINAMDEGIADRLREAGCI